MGDAKLEANNNNSILVTFPHGKKYPYLTSFFLLANSLYIGINAFIDLSLYYYLVFVLPFLPFLVISLWSQKENHIFEVLDDSLVIGETEILYSSLKKVVIYNPITIYFHLMPTQKGKRLITIQVNKSEAENAFLLITKWAHKNCIEIEKHY